MPAAQYHLTVDIGATFELSFTFMVASSSVDPTPVPMDLNGYTALSQIRDAYGNPNYLAQMTVSFPPSGSTTGSTSSAGVLVLSLSAAQTAILPTLRGVWDLKLIQGSTVLRVVEGEAWLKPQVSI